MVSIRGGSPAVAVTTGAGAPSVTLTGTRQPQASDKLLIIHTNNWYTLSVLGTPTIGGSAAGMTAVPASNLDAGTNSVHIKLWEFPVGSTGDLTVQAVNSGASDEEQALVVYVVANPGASLVDAALGTFNTSSVDPHPLNGVTTTTANGILIGHVETQTGAPTYTPPGGMTEQYDQAIGSGICEITGATETLGAAGPTGTRSFDPSAGAAYGGVLVALTGDAVVLEPVGMDFSPPRLGGPLRGTPSLAPLLRAPSFWDASVLGATVDLNPGEISLTGVAASEVVPVVTLTPGSVNFSGQALAIQQVRDLTPGAIGFAGTDSGVQRVIVPTPGAVTFTGVAPSALSPVVTLTPGALAFSGQAATVQRVVAASPGTITFSGADAGVQRVVVPAAGIITFSGVPLIVPTVALTPGTISFAGVAASAVTPVTVLTPGVWSLSGVAPTVTPTTVLTPGVLNFSGQMAAVQRVVAITPGSLAFTGVAASSVVRVLVPTPGTISFVGVAPSGVVLQLGLTPGVISFSGVPLGMTGNVDLTPGVVVFSGPGASVQRVVSLTPGAIGFTGQAATVQRVVVASPGTITFAGVSAAVQARVLLTPGIVGFVGVPLGVPAKVNLSPGAVAWEGLPIVIIPPGPIRNVVGYLRLQDEALSLTSEDGRIYAGLRDERLWIELGDVTE